jgi:hypothetical protein
VAKAIAASAVDAPHPLPATGGRLRFEFVAADNEWEVRQLLRETPLPGWITLAYEREPDYLLGTTLEGTLQQTVLARTIADGTLVGTFSRSERLAFVNGEPRPLGYLGLLRLRDHFRGRTRYLREGYEVCRRFLHDPTRTPYYVTSIIEGNATARRVLEAGLPGLPTYRPWQKFSTLALPCRRTWGSVPSGLRIVPGSPELLGDIAACLQRNYARYALAPYWTAEDLASSERCRGLHPQDFCVALRRDRVVGCLALWDQRAFKQHVVRGYVPGVERWRRPINAATRLLSLPHLPEPGAALAEAALSHAASDDDDPTVLTALITATRAEAQRRGLEVVTLGLAQRNPMLRAVRAAFRHLEYRSILYLVHWEDGRSAAAALDDRPAHLEAATL